MQPVVWSFTFLSIGFAYAGIRNWDACSGRLERALDALRRDSIRGNRFDKEEAGTLYQRELRSVPLEMSISCMAVKLPEKTKESGGNYWARVERCVYEPKRNSLRTRVVLNDLSVSGTVSLMSRDRHSAAISTAESCRMTLRLRRAGIDFLTSPIARAHGQMRIRTESSFLEPKFASIYAYGCHPTRLDKQIKRQDKWPPHYSAADKVTSPTPALILNDKYDAAEPRQLTGVTEEMDVVLPNENRHARYLHAPEADFGVRRENSWITKSSSRQRRSMIQRRLVRTALTVAPRDFASGLGGLDEGKPMKEEITNLTLDFFKSLPDESAVQNVSREVRESISDDNYDSVFSTESKKMTRNQRLKEHITWEMEDAFLQSASQTLTTYIERQLHPAIKETLMLSMGYTISYG